MNHMKRVLAVAFATVLVGLVALTAIELPTLAEAEVDSAGSNVAQVQANFEPTPGLMVSESSHNFGEIPFDQFGTQTWQFQVRNNRENPQGSVQVFPLVSAADGSPNGAVRAETSADAIGYGQSATITVTLDASKRPTTPGVKTYTIDFMGRDNAYFPTVEITFTMKIDQITIQTAKPTYTKVWGAKPDPSKIMVDTNYGSMSFEQLGLKVDKLTTETDTGDYPVTSEGKFQFTNDPLPNLHVEVTKARLTPRPNITVPTYESGAPLSSWTPTDVKMYNTSNNTMVVDGAFTWDYPDFGIRPVGNTTSSARHTLTFTPRSEADQKHYETYTQAFDVKWQGKVGAEPHIVISNTTHTYDGSQKSVTVDTNTKGRKTILYNGSSNAPRDAGTYTVVVTTEATADFAAGRKEATLTINKAKLTVPAPTATKEYGAPATSLGTKSVLGKGNAYVLVQFASTGNTQTAEPGNYAITATPTTSLNQQNYDVSTEGGNFYVSQATPVITDTSAGTGQAGKPLSSLPDPTFTAKNKYLNETVSGTLTWKNPETRLTEGHGSYTCVFTPDETSKVKYKSTETNVTVNATAKPVVNLTVDESSLSYVYDTSPHTIVANSTTNGAKVTITYTVNGVKQSTGPTNVGEYPFEARASVANGEYVDNVITGKLVITQATPSGYATASGDGGSTLTHYTLTPNITGVKGEKLTGSISWNNPNTEVKPGVAYPWTFKPSNTNYHSIPGSTIVKAGDIQVAHDKETLRKLVQEANALRGQTTVSPNGSNVPPSKMWVTQEVEDTLMAHIAHAERHLVDGYATQAEIDHCIQPLTTAMESYRNSMKPGTQSTGGSGGGGGGAAPAPSKKQSSVVLSPSVVRMNPGDDPVEVKVTGEGDGKIIAAGTNDNVAFVENRGSSLYVTAKNQGTSEVRVTRTATADYDEASATLVVVVGEAPEDFDPDAVQPEPEIDGQRTYRLYNPYNGKHLFVQSQTEVDQLVAAGWTSEGSHKMPASSRTPVYRLYNQYTTEHHYTTDKDEYDRCVKGGWTGEGISFYSDDDKAVPVYRLYNRWAPVGTHHYTESATERDNCIKAGWKLEGVGWHYMD